MGPFLPDTLEYKLSKMHECISTDDNLAKTTDRDLSEYEHIVDEKTLELRLTGLTTSDSGNYYCQINQSAIGGKKDKTVNYSHLTVEGKSVDRMCAFSCICFIDFFYLTYIQVYNICIYIYLITVCFPF